MEVKFEAAGQASYSLYKENKKGEKVPVTNKEAKEEYNKSMITVAAAAGLIIAGTLALDGLTGGISTLDDPASFTLAGYIITKAFGYAY